MSTRTIAPWAAGLTLALACSTAGARMHQICFEVAPENKSGVTTPAAVFGCAIDGGGSCTITALTGGMSSSPFAPVSQFVQSPGTFKHFSFVFNLGLMQARVDFFDSNGTKIADRTCTVNAQGAATAHAGGATPGAVLTGFSTDASGLATTGVWKRQTSFAPSARSNLAIAVPFDFVAVGGGAMGVASPIGALITRSQFEVSAGIQRTWRAQTSEAGGAAQPHQVTTFAIGLRIEGLHSRDLTPQLQTVFAGSTPAVAGHPSAQANQPVIGGSVILSGTIAAFADSSNAPIDQIGQFATVSAPVVGTALQCTQPAPGFFKCIPVPAITGWRVESKDHVVPHPGSVSVQMLALPTSLLMSDNVTRFEVRGKHVAATSAVAAHPAVDVAGLRGEYALTGIGASVDWRRFDPFGNQTAAGNLLWKMEPRADFGGASVAAKDHIISSPASVTAFALGIKLVAPGTPPESPICCRRL